MVGSVLRTQSSVHVSDVHHSITLPTSQPLWKATTTQERNNCNDRTQFQ